MSDPFPYFKFFPQAATLEMESFFIASFPGNPKPADTLKQIKDAVSAIDTPHELPIPELRVGTLDNLLTIADSVVKTDQTMQQLTYKIEKQLREFLPNEALLIDASFFHFSSFIASYCLDRACC